MRGQPFSTSDILSRRAKLLAELLRDHWEEGSGFDTRLFDRPFIQDHMVFRGRSVKGGGYREHIVPRVVIRDGCLRMLDAGAKLHELQQAIVDNLGIVEVTSEEAYYLDFHLNLKTVMPPGWQFGVGDPFARIRSANIELLR